MLGYAKVLVAVAMVLGGLWVAFGPGRRRRLLSVAVGLLVVLAAAVPAYKGVQSIRNDAFLAAIKRGFPAGLTDRDLGWDDGFPELREAHPDLKKLFAASKGRWKAWEALSDVDKDNLRFPDLRGFDPADLSKPLSVATVLKRTEDWEYPGGRRDGDDSLGYAAVVKNVYGTNPDGKYYIFYAHHDVPSGIGCAVADSPDGPFRKLKELDPSREDSCVIKPPQSRRPLLGGTPTAHYSSPCVLWSPEEKKWFLYFHFYKNEFTEGRGHQKTALAVCSDLASARWTIVLDRSGDPKAVLPTTVERWMNSQSSYHAVQRLPNGLWLAFLRGTGGEYTPAGEWKQDITKIGFAVSRDGRKWTLLPNQPAIFSGGPNGKRDGCYRPWFVSPLAPDRFAACWGESSYYDSDATGVWAETSDFRTFKRPAGSELGWKGEDGASTVWREGDSLWIYTGKKVARYRVSR